MQRFYNNTANVLTILNLICGVSAIFLAIDSNLKLANFLVLLGLIFDISDGYLAHKLKINSSFGSQLDSLADIITFAIAPSTILHIAYANIFISISGIVLITCGALRLARYNATNHNHIFFIGLPINASSSIPLTLIFFKPPALITISIVYALSILFISKYKIYRPFI